MNYFKIDFNEIFKIGLLGKEHLYVPRLHKERRVNDYIMYIILNGVLKLEVNGEEIELLPGDMYLFNKGDYQKPVCSTECEYYYLHFDANCDYMSNSENNFLHTVRQKNIEIMKSSLYGFGIYKNFNVYILQKLHLEPNNLKLIVNKLSMNELKESDISIKARLEISHNIEKMFITIEQICEGNYNISSKKMRVYNLVKEITDYINNNFFNQIGRKEIENKFLINYDYANRIFKNIMGESIVKYRNLRRIERAKYMLLNTQKSIEDISYEIGFDDKYYFCKIFTKMEGLSPMTFKSRKEEYDLR